MHRTSTGIAICTYRYIVCTGTGTGTTTDNNNNNCRTVEREAHRDIGHVLLRGEDKLVVRHVVRSVAQARKSRGRVQCTRHAWNTTKTRACTIMTDAG